MSSWDGWECEISNYDAIEDRGAFEAKYFKGMKQNACQKIKHGWIYRYSIPTTHMPATVSLSPHHKTSS